jgi:hypothetical protein
VTRKLLLVTAVIAVSFIAVGAARADVPPLPPGTDWCGQATCDSSMAYVECSDGSIWAIEQDWDVDGFGEAMCNGDYAVLVAPPDFTSLGGEVPSSGIDVGLGADPNMAPDPSQYGTEVRCPDGSVWAVPIGDDFICPAT